MENYQDFKLTNDSELDASVNILFHPDGDHQGIKPVLQYQSTEQYLQVSSVQSTEHLQNLLQI